jgi:1,4-alpha-glucan branching enzyme
MREKQDKKGKEQRRITFSLEAPWAQSVSVLGDFNQWNGEKHKMKREENGVWSRMMMLEPGRYEYKFLVDGDWWHDPKNDQNIANEFGSLNSVLNVKKAVKRKS